MWSCAWTALPCARSSTPSRASSSRCWPRRHGSRRRSTTGTGWKSAACWPLGRTAIRPRGTTVERQQRLLEASFATLEQKSNLLLKKIAQVRSQIAAVEAQLTAKNDQIALVDEDLAKAEMLAAQGLIKAVQVSDLRKERVRLIGEAGSLAANTAELNEKTVELELELLALPVERRNAGGGGAEQAASR